MIKRRLRSNKVRNMIGSSKASRRLGISGTLNVRDSRKWVLPVEQAAKVFVGPSVEGGDAEYILIASGKVSQKKPSFAR
ncbi:hypothetical protein [Paenibacillus cremeus]|uniref:Uncharacterized protein n=1 Tax=Paenibacillus cremeus TaxID=2163881 RepID=A0A559JET8_9BACL|nr:hypothetical protein [Paenibacillus cremeus]TVX98383.1 hypothetical protein FPZ49_34535 [Paenibacillus cremeus]